MEVHACGLRWQVWTRVELEGRDGPWRNVWRSGRGNGAWIRLYAGISGISCTAGRKQTGRWGGEAVSRGYQLPIASAVVHGRLEAGASAEVKPPNLVALLHLVRYTPKYPDPPVPDPACMIITMNKFPRARPCPGLQIQEAYVVQHTVVPRLPPAYVEFLVVDDGGVASSAAGCRAVQFRLRPVRRLQIENDDVGQMLSVFILSAKYEKLVTLPETCRMAHSDSWYVTIVVDKIPLAGNEVQAQDVIIHFVCELVESAKGVDLVIADVGDRGIDKAGWFGADGRYEFRSVQRAFGGRLAVSNRARRHEEGIGT